MNSISEERQKLLKKANELLHIDKFNNLKLVFVYSCPKVGSTSVVSSLRLFGSDKVYVIHIHDEEMLKVLAHIENITVNEIIEYNRCLGKNVYVINIYRSPIERKISAFFEKIGAYHFNNEDSKLNSYNILKVINRFNNIFPHIALGDHFIDKYGIAYPERFDYVNKYLLVRNNGITYISLRLKDSALWGSILSNIFGFKICVVRDYESTNKPIKDLYNTFKSTYKIPINLLNDIMNCKYLNYYYDADEKNIYYNDWLLKITDPKESYNVEQYKLYEEITIENCHYDYIQLDHYMDEGCVCKACSMKRSDIVSKLLGGLQMSEKIVHIEAKTELLNNRVKQVNSVITNLSNNVTKTFKRKDFKKEMSNLLHNKK
jgi:hypothetical protein